ncbi:MAG: hypothetical protein ACRDOI_38535, partial [Trebonia sp.]
MTALSAAHSVDLLENSWPVQTAGGTLITVLLTWLATLFLTRKRIAWRVYTDDDFKLERGQAESAGERISLKIEVPSKGSGKKTDVVDNPRLVVLRIRNSGLGDLKKTDFDPPLAFIFPGREVRHAEIVRKSDGVSTQLDVQRTTATPTPERSRFQRFADDWLPQRLAHVLGVEPLVRVTEPTVGVVTLENLAINKNSRFTLMAVVSGKPPRQAGNGLGGRGRGRGTGTGTGTG